MSVDPCLQQPLLLQLKSTTAPIQHFYIYHLKFQAHFIAVKQIYSNRMNYPIQQQSSVIFQSILANTFLHLINIIRGFHHPSATQRPQNSPQPSIPRAWETSIPICLLPILMSTNQFYYSMSHSLPLISILLYLLLSSQLVLHHHRID